MDGAPFERYTFILHISEGAGCSGMEHANSTAISASSDEYLPSVAAHEFFHLWNVKRIRPASLEPVDHTKEQFTRALWFAEGVTNTYASYTLVRSGIWSKEQFYADLGEQITELEARPANRWQSAEQSSLDAWLAEYEFCQTGKNVSRQFGHSSDSGERRRRFVRRVFREIRGRDGLVPVPENSGAGRFGAANRGAPQTDSGLLCGARTERRVPREHG